MKAIFVGLAVLVTAVGPARADDTVTYDCSAYPAPDHLRIHPAIIAVDAVVKHRWTSTRHHFDGMAAWVDRVVAALRAVGATDLATLTIDDRIELQGLLYDLARRLAFDEHRWWNPAGGLNGLARRAGTLIRAVAPSRDALVALGREPSDELARWIGPRSTWVERATIGELSRAGDGKLFHEHVSRELVAFRLIRSGSRRTLLAQRVAFDRTGRAHVTPQLSSLELRDGMDVDAPACVAHDHDGALEAVAFGDLKRAIVDDVYGRVGFIHVTERGVGCKSCHRTADSIPISDVVDRARAAAIVDVRYRRVEVEAERMLGEISKVK
jgi:hypothetical protein